MEGWTSPSVLVGCAAVLAALISGGIVWRRKKLFFDQRFNLPVNDGPRIHGIELKAFLNGNMIEGHVHALFGGFVNTGGRDIVSEDFVTGLPVTLPQGAKALEVRLFTPKGVKSDYTSDEGLIGIRWDILKPRERVDLVVIASSTDRIEGNLASEPRLRDVAVGPRTLTLPFTRPGVLITILIIAFIVFTILTWHSSTSVWRAYELRLQEKDRICRSAVPHTPLAQVCDTVSEQVNAQTED